MAQTEPQAPPAPGSWSSLVTDLVLPAVAHLLLFFLADLVARHRLLATADPILHLFGEERRQFLLDLALAYNLVSRVAMVSLPVIILVILVRWRTDADPLKGVGLGPYRGCFPLVAGAMLFGGLGHFALQLGAVTLAGGKFAGVEYFVALLRQIARFASFGWLGALALPATALTYATARLLIPIGHLPRLLRRRLPPALATLLVGLLFAVPYAFSVAITPLLFINLLLLGILAERLTARTGSLWPALAMLAGWVVLGELSPLPYQATMLAEPAFVTGSPLITGGMVGPEGGLLMTMLVSAGLASLLRRRRSVG